jgi:hypothetical protein
MALYMMPTSSSTRMRAAAWDKNEPLGASRCPPFTVWLFCGCPLCNTIYVIVKESTKCCQHTILVRFFYHANHCKHACIVFQFMLHRNWLSTCLRLLVLYLWWCCCPSELLMALPFSVRMSCPCFFWLGLRPPSQGLSQLLSFFFGLCHVCLRGKMRFHFVYYNCWDVKVFHLRGISKCVLVGS